MDRKFEEPAARFALEILRNHPQISYEHAVSAAEYAGVQRLPRSVFLEAAERLGIPRDQTAIEPVQTLDVDRPRRLRDEPNGTSATLLAQLDAFQQLVAETGEIRTALERMRLVVRAALAET